MVGENSSKQVLPLYQITPSRSPDPLLSSITVRETSTSTPTNASNNGCSVQPSELETWLPLTESRDGTTYSAAFHILCSGIGFQALLLSVAFAALGWAWGIICLSLAFAWQLYTIWLLVHLHEPDVPGPRYSRYLRLSMAAFGQKRGKLLGIFPVMYLSGGSCVMLIITGGAIMEQLFKIMCGGGPTCDHKSLTGTEWFLVFTCIAIVIAQLPNLNSIARVSLTGAITAIFYCTFIWVLSITKERPHNVTYNTPDGQKMGIRGFGNIMNAIGIIVLAFRGHNLVLEIQGTLPSSSKDPAFKSMWRGVTISYLITAMCLFPLAIGGFWAYGDRIPVNGGILSALFQFHREGTSKYLMGLIYVMVLISCFSSFQIYAMPVFDNFEFLYITKKKRRCSALVRMGLRLFFGGLAFFIAVALPFLGSLTALIGGLALPLTYVYPCFMWISIKRPRRNGAMWCFNLGLGCLGIILTILLVVAASWNLADKGLNANFFKPK